MTVKKQCIILYITDNVFHKGRPVKTSLPLWHTNIKLGNWRDKAGGYGIQEPFGALSVKRINGDYNNVIGLPISRLYQELKKLKLI